MKGGVYRMLTKQEAPKQKTSDRQRQAKHVASITPQNKEKKQLIL